MSERGGAAVPALSARPGTGEASFPVISRASLVPEVWVAVDRADAALARGPVAQRDAARAAAMPPWRSAEFLAARALLRTLLGQVAGAAGQAAIVADERGRPVLAGWPQIGVSISHDGGYVAACAGRGTDVGVDIQVPPDQVSEAVMRRCLGPRLGLLDGQPQADRIRAFTWLWTTQEACVKASGMGLAGRPWSVDVPPGAISGRWQGYRWAALRDSSAIPLSCAFADPGDAA
jgi:4'-phosphopantetheinyl transferase